MAHIGILLLEGGQLVGGEATEQVGSQGKGQVSFSTERAFVPFQKTISKIEPDGKGIIEVLADLARQSEELPVTFGSGSEGLGSRVCRGRTSQGRTNVAKQATNLPPMYLT